MAYMTRLTQDELAAVISVLDELGEKHGPIRRAHTKLVNDYQRRKVSYAMCTKGQLAPVESRPRVSFASRLR
jgi:hypothetical protein